MPSAPTTSIDLGAADVVADPYPHFARERSLHEVAWHEPSGTWLTFSHAAAGAVLRNRRLGRIWRDREPADYLEPFNLLHRNQMMENEPPEHTRLRRAVAGAFNRGHVERLRPRVQSLAASLLDDVDPAGFDVIGEYAEPLPVLVIAELIGLASDRRALAATVGRRRSCGCTSPRRPTTVVAAAVSAADRVRRPCARAPRPAAVEPGRRPDHRPAGRRAERRRAGRGRRAPAERRARGVGERVRQRPGRPAGPRPAAWCGRQR